MNLKGVDEESSLFVRTELDEDETRPEVTSPDWNYIVNLEMLLQVGPREAES